MKDKEKAKESMRLWYLKNKERHNKKSREYYHTDKSRDRNRVLLKKFGITLQKYEEMLEEQEGKCAICGKHHSEFKRVFAVDHNHTTGEVRSLLCHRCNTAIGLAEENSEILENMIKISKQS